jgi:hypothetical protein
MSLFISNIFRNSSRNISGLARGGFSGFSGFTAFHAALGTEFEILFFVSRVHSFSGFATEFAWFLAA